MVKVIIADCFEHQFNSISSAKRYVNAYCCYQPGTCFTILDEDDEEVGFGVFVNEFVLEDGDSIYTPEWFEEPADDMIHVGYFDDDGRFHRSMAEFKTREEAQEYCDSCNFGDPLHYIVVE